MYVGMIGVFEGIKGAFMQNLRIGMWWIVVVIVLISIMIVVYVVFVVFVVVENGMVVVVQYLVSKVGVEVFKCGGNVVDVVVVVGYVLVVVYLVVGNLGGGGFMII